MSSLLCRVLSASSLAVIATASVVAAADPSPSVSPSSLPTIAVTPDWQSLQPTAVIDVPGAVGFIPMATDGRTIWVVGVGELLRIDGATNAVEHLVAPVAADDTGLLYADDGLWATRWSGGKLYRLDPTTGGVELEVGVPYASGGLLIDDQLWVGREALGDMVPVDRVTGAVGDPRPLGGYGMGSFWFPHPDVHPPTITRVDAATGETIATIELPEAPHCNGGVFGGDFPEAVYGGCSFGAEATARPFSRIDPGTNNVVATTVLPKSHGAVPIVLDGQIWLVGSFESADGTPFGGMVRVDPDSGAIEQWVSLGDIDPDPPLHMDGAIWVGADGGHRVQRYDVASLAAH